MKPCVVVLAAALSVLVHSASAQTPSRIGIVVMHGKGGSPSQHVAQLASSLERKGFRVASLEMPWSGRRSYDASVADAVAQVDAALASLRSHGAVHLFLAGHSQGGLFALYFAGQRAVDGLVAIAPGGNTASPAYRENLGESVAQARKLIDEGKGTERARFLDYEGSKGAYEVTCTPANYLSWFDPEGAMNESVAVRRISPEVPVLFIVPRRDYPGLQKAKQPMFDALPRNALTKLYEPDSSHIDAPSASVDEIERWIAEVAVRAESQPR